VCDEWTAVSLALIVRRQPSFADLQLYNQLWSLSRPIQFASSASTRPIRRIVWIKTLPLEGSVVAVAQKLSLLVAVVRKPSKEFRRKP
jgi:hypothetical protein